jgi:glucose 1-dehydrogenase
LELGATLDRIDLILESTGASIAAFEAMQILGNNGVLVLLSLTGTDIHAEVPIDRINRELVAGNKTVVGSVNAVRSLVRFDALWPGLAEHLITSRLAIYDIGQVTEKTAADVKMVVKF